MNKLYKDIRYVGGEINLTYTVRTKPSERKDLTEQYDIVEFFRSMYDESIYLVESAYAILLDARCRCMGVISCGEGDCCSCWVNTRKILKAAILCEAKGFYLCHNHPSGETTPSNEDNRLTTEISRASQALHIRLLDHFIISPEGDYYSYRDEGKL